MNSRFVHGALGACLVLGAAPVSAAEVHRFYAKAGAFFSHVDSTLRIDANELDIGTGVDLESDLKLSTKEILPFGLIGWRFSEDWRLEAEYFSLNRTSTTTLERDITVGDTVYPVNGTVTGGLESTVYRLGVGYSFLNRPDLELGAILGAHLSDFSVFIEGNGRVGEQVGGFRREERNQLVPLPTLGLYGRFALNDTFSLGARVDYFTLKIDNYRGRLIDTSAGINARITRNIAVGADFRFVDYGLEASAEDFTGRVDYRFYGPYLYLSVGF